MRLLSKNAGFSLIEIVMVMGLMSVIGVGTMQMVTKMQRGQNDMNVSLATRDLIEDMRTTLSVPEICPLNFEGIEATSGMSPVAINPINVAGPTPKFQKDGVYESRSVKITSMLLGNYSEIAPLVGTIDFTVGSQKLKDTGTVPNITRVINLVVRLDSATSNKIIACATPGNDDEVTNPSPSPLPSPSMSASPTPSPLGTPTPSPSASGSNITLGTEACEAMGGRYVPSIQRCFFRQLVATNDEDLMSSPAMLDVHEDTRGKLFTVYPNGKVTIGLQSLPATPFGSADLFLKSGLYFSGSTTIPGGGTAQGYLTVDGDNNDIDIGSTNPKLVAVTFWNQGSGKPMSMLINNSVMNGLCLDTKANCGGSLLVDGKINNAVGERLKVDGTGRFSGKLYAPGFVNTSDRRLKKNILPLGDSLQKLLSLQGVAFEWRRNIKEVRHAPKARDMGFIAQEVEEVFPNLVTTSPNGYKAVSYDGIIPVVVEALKEVWQNVQALGAKEEALEKKIEDQQSQINELKTLVCKDHPKASVCQ